MGRRVVKVVRLHHIEEEYHSPAGRITPSAKTLAPDAAEDNECFTMRMSVIVPTSPCVVCTVADRRYFFRKSGGDESPMCRISEDRYVPGGKEVIFHSMNSAIKDNKIATTDCREHQGIML